MRLLNFIAILFFVLLNFQVSTQITADFSSDISSGCEVAVVSFTDLSSSSAGAIVSWNWDLDITSSQEQNPGLIFNNVGSYTICLEATDIMGNVDTVCKTNFINVHPNPEAAYTVDINEGCEPLTVSYTDNTTSSSPIQQWTWNIGGSTGLIITQDPTEVITSTFNNQGSYGLSLSVIDQNECSNTITDTDIITVHPLPQIDASVELKNPCGFPKIYDLIINNPVNGVNYEWQIEGGQVFTGANVIALPFNDPGVFDVLIIATNENCSDSLLLEDIIDTELSLEISLSQQSICVKESVVFGIDGATNIDSIFWNFGDGSSSTQTSPSHNFLTAGCFDITSIVYLGNCIDTLTHECIDVLELPTTPSVSAQITQGCQMPSILNLTSLDTLTGTFTWSVTGTNLDTIVMGDNVDLPLNNFGSYEISGTFTNANACSIDVNLTPIVFEEFDIEIKEEGPSGCIPLDISPLSCLLDSSGIISYHWIIDGGLFQSTETNPTFTFVDTGKYDLKLVVMNEDGCQDSLFMPNYFRAGIPPIVDFVGTPQEDCASFANSFMDLSSDYADEWFWEFGDGDTSSVQNPMHLYKDSLFFDVTLTAWHNGCQSQEFKPNYIHPLAPIAKFNIHYNCDNPYQVGLNEFSIGADSLIWFVDYHTHVDTFYQRDTMTLQFPERGDYNVTLYNYNYASDCEYERTKVVEIRDPEAAFELDTIKGCVPYSINIHDLSIDAERYKYNFDNWLENDTLNDPIANMTQAGVYHSPSLIITDIHDCTDEYVFPDSIYVNAVLSGAEYRDHVCLPDTISFNDSSQSLFGEINNWDWNIDGKASEEAHANFSFTANSDFDLSLKVIDNWNCADSLFEPNAISFSEPLVDFYADVLSCTWHEINFTNLSSQDLINNYFWEFGDGQSSTDLNPSHLYENEGLYTVCLTIESTSGCVKTICKENYIQIANPVAGFEALNNTIFCPPLLTDFTNTSINSVSYEWDFGDNTGSSFLDEPSHIYNNPGTYDVLLISSLNEFCQDTLLIEEFIRVDGPVGNFQMISDSSCVPLSIQLIAEANDSFEFVWDFGNGLIQETSGLAIHDTVAFTYYQTGSYIPRMILTDTSGCSISYTGEEVVVDELILDFTIPDSLFCFNDIIEIQLENHSTSNSNNVDYTWTVPQVPGLISNEYSPKIPLQDVGVFDVWLHANTGFCKDSLNKSSAIELIQKVDLEAQGDTICFGEEATIRAFGNALELDWINMDGSLIARDKKNVSVSPHLTEMYMVIGKRSTCETDTAYANVFVHDEIIIELEEQYRAYPNLDVQINLWYDESNDYDFQWTPPDFLSCDDCPRPWIVDIDRPMDYKLIVTDNKSACAIERQVDVNFKNDCTEKAFYLPNVFSPNEDGSNDGWRIFAQDEREFIELAVFDRWGEEMFYTEDIEKEWDGIFLNEPLQPAIYAVTIKALCLTSNEEYRINTTVAIMR